MPEISRRDLLKTGTVVAVGAVAAAALPGFAGRARGLITQPASWASVLPFICGSAAPSADTSFTVDVTATTRGGLILVCVKPTATVSSISVSDSQGNSYSQVAHATNQYLFAATSTVILTAGTDTWTVTISSSDAANILCVNDPASAGADSGSVVSTTGQGTSATIASGALAGNERVFFFANDGPLGGTPSWASGTTSIGSIASSSNNGIIIAGYQDATTSSVTGEAAWADTASYGITVAGFTPIPAPSSTIYSVNYFPPVNGGYSMWTNYSHAQTVAAINAAQNLGFNSLRVILAASDDAFSFPSPTAGQLANLQDVYVSCINSGMSLHLTFFDQWSQFGYIDGSNTWLEAVIGSLRNVNSSLSNIWVMETKNELFSAANENVTYTEGFDAGWPGLEPVDGVIWDFDNPGNSIALIWVELVTAQISSLAPDIPITTSMPSGQGTSTTGLGFYYNNVNGTSYAPAWYDYHLYGGGVTGMDSLLQDALSAVGNDTSMLYIGEFGYDLETTEATSAELQDQAEYVQNARYYCQQLGLREPEYWILYDMEKCLQFPDGQSDGLYATDGTRKLSGDVYAEYPPGSTVPPYS
jgi:hypothetical protein